MAVARAEAGSHLGSSSSTPEREQEMSKRIRASLAILPAALLLAGCATLGEVIQPPQFSVAQNRPAELQLIGPSLQNPVGGVSIRLWANVANPNPMGIVLSALNGALALEGTEAARVAFPLGLPLPAARDTVIPLDISVSFTNVPRLADVVSRAMTQGSVAYRLNGTVAVDAGLLGQPSFGPMTLLQGNVQTRR
jgi:hypothetical protein